MKGTLPARVRFAEFELELRSGELRGGGQTVRLTEKPLRVLMILVEHSGELVTREEIQKKLWPNDTIVDFEHGINTAIKVLRRALGESVDQPKYIETLARRGYRLMVPVEWVSPANDESSSGKASSSHDGTAARIQLAPEFLIGKKVAHYRVLEVIGGGGMGMVYKAEDLKLGRHVALKFLPEELARDPISLQRFEREAQTASSLDHPNICTIYEVEEHDEQPFIVMQLLEGKTLRDRLATVAAEQKTLPVDELLDIAIQIAAGLEAAHAKGIIHRDIKPANIFLTSAGPVKILDFGLAKAVSTAHEAGSDGLLLQTDGGGAAVQPARCIQPDATLTRIGAAMGTAGYMSPEQIRGEKLDARTDIFSFGLVLYELATGQRAFIAETAALVREAILNTAPAATQILNSALPPKLVAVIDKALEKDRAQRYQSAAEIGTALEEVRRFVAPSPVFARRVKRIAVASFVMLLVAACAAGIWWWRRPLAERAFRNWQMIALTSTGNVNVGDLSPDGRYLAYNDDEMGAHSLWVRQPGTWNTVRVVGPISTWMGFMRFSLNGDFVYYDLDGTGSDGGGLYGVPVTGGQPKKILADVAWGSSVGFSPDGKQIVFVLHDISENTNHLVIASADGSGHRRLLTLRGRTSLFWPVWSPDGQTIAFGIDEGGVGGPDCLAIVSSKGGTERRILRHVVMSGHAWLSDQSGLVIAGQPQGTDSSALWVVTYPEGDLRRITSDLVDYTGASLARGSSRLMTVQMHRESSLWVAPALNPSQATQIRQGAGRTDGIKGVAWLADESVVYASGARQSEIWTVLLDGTHRRQITHTDNSSATPLATTPEGPIVFAKRSPDSGISNIWTIDVDGNNPRQVTSGSTSKWAPEISSDGKWLTYESTDGPWKMPFNGGEPTSLNRDGEVPTISPDGRFVAFCYWGEKKNEIEIVSLDGRTPPRFLPFIRDTQIPQTAGVSSIPIRWTADGKAITYVRTKEGASNIWAQPIDGSAARQLTNFTSMIIWRHDWSRDGKSLVMARGNFSRDAVMLTDLR